MSEKIREFAKAKMLDGYNCCQAVLITCDVCFDLALPAELVTAGRLFGNGTQSGCVCGALTGLIMAAGILDEKYPHPLGGKLGAHVHRRFCEKFGSACCREIRSGMSFLAKMGHKGCRELTGEATEILCELWGDKVRPVHNMGDKKEICP